MIALIIIKDSHVNAKLKIINLAYANDILTLLQNTLAAFLHVI